MHLLTTDSALQVWVAGTTQTLTLHGPLDLVTRDAIVDAVALALLDGCEIIVIDLSQATFVDVAGVHALLGAQRHVRARGARLVILPAPESVQAVFRLCGVADALPFIPVSRRVHALSA